MVFHQTGDLVKRHLEARQTAVQLAIWKPTLEQVKECQFSYPKSDLEMKTIPCGFITYQFGVH